MRDYQYLHTKQENTSDIKPVVSEGTTVKLAQQTASRKYARIGPNAIRPVALSQHLVTN